MEEKKKINVGKIIAISAGVAVTVAAILFVVYKFLKKHFKVTFDCGDCSECEENCFGDGFDFDFTDDDYEPACSLDDDDADEDADGEEEKSENA